MIFFAVAGPTPGSASRSFSDAEFRSTGPDGASADLDEDLDEDFEVVVLDSGADELDVALEDFSVFAGFSAASEVPAGLELVLVFDFETVTSGVILSIVFAGTPAFERSATEEYGRPSMIFFAVAVPTPGSASRSAWEAVLRSTFLALAACATDEGRTSASTRSPTRLHERFESIMASPFAGQSPGSR